MSKMKIEVDNQTIARFWLILIAFIIGGALVYWARHGLVLLGTALFLAMALNPIVARLAKSFFKGKRVLATALTFVGVVLVVVVVGALVIPTIVSQTAGLVQHAPEAISNTLKSLAEANNQIDKHPLGSLANEVINWIDSNKGSWASSVGNTLFTGIGSVLSSAASTFLILVVTFLILVDAPNLVKYIWSFYKRPAALAHHQKLVGKMYRVVAGFVGGQLTVAVIDGATASLLVLILHFIFGFSAAIVAPIGLLVLLMAFIPYVGSAISMIVGSLIILLYSWQAALAFAICYVIYQQIEGNVIAPMIQSKKIEMPTLLVMVAIVIGMYMFGVLGGIISIPIAGCLKVLLEDYQARQLA